MSDLVMRLSDVRFARYLFAAVGALAVDMGSFVTLLALHTPAGVAAFSGYSLGIVANWMLLSRWVFGDSLAARGAPRVQQKALFAVTTLLGLGLTTAIVSGAAAAGFNVIVTKGVAIVVSFTVNWLVRRHYIFKPLAPAASA